MNEYHIGFGAVAGLVGLAVGCLLYMMGGRNNKALRRYVGSFVIAATVWANAVFMGVFSWLWLIIYPLKVGEFSMGYSRDRGLPAPVKRALVTGLSVLGGTICAYTLGGSAWFLLGLHAFVGAGTILFAFKNPIAAAAEEPLVCMLNSSVLMFYPFVGG